VKLHSYLSNRTWLEVDRELQKAMYVAIELLKMLRRSHHHPRRSARIQAEITAVAQWTEFLFEQREHTAMEITGERPETVKLGGRLVCNKCRKSPNDYRRRTSARTGPVPSPIWKAQREFLLACTKIVSTEQFAQDCASCNLRNFPGCLAMLMKALRYFGPVGVGETKIEVEHPSNVCALCGEPVEPPSDNVL